MRLERKDERPAPAPRFYLRLAKYVALCFALAVASLEVGMLGYRHFEEQSWPEAFLNAAMLLAAMGPVSEPQTTGGKVFAGCYALYCGLLFLVVAGLLVTPFAHRLLHLFHSDPDDE